MFLILTIIIPLSCHVMSMPIKNSNILFITVTMTIPLSRFGLLQFPCYVLDNDDNIFMFWRWKWQNTCHFFDNGKKEDDKTIYLVMFLMMTMPSSCLWRWWYPCQVSDTDDNNTIVIFLTMTIMIPLSCFLTEALRMALQCLGRKRWQRRYPCHAF
jgi:hypothetical protein